MSGVDEWMSGGCGLLSCEGADPTDWQQWHGDAIISSPINTGHCTATAVTDTAATKKERKKTTHSKEGSDFVGFSSLSSCRLGHSLASTVSLMCLFVFSKIMK